MPSADNGAGGAALGAAERRQEHAVLAARLGSQRRRLLDAAVELAARHGIGRVTTLSVCSHARISTATFYECFDGLDDCLREAYRVAARRLASAVPEIPASDSWLTGMRAAVSMWLGALRDDPDAARMVLVEGLGGGRDLRAEHRRTMDRCVTAFRSLPAANGRAALSLDIQPEVLVAALQGVAVRCLLTHTEDRLPGLTDDLFAWVCSYLRPAGEPRWVTASHRFGPHPTPGPRLSPADRPAAPPRGRHHLPPGVQLRVRRARIIHATARLTRERGYGRVTVGEIVAAAHISRNVFYESFAGKHEAFIAAQDYGSAGLLDECASAYFRGASWPERIWGLLGAVTDMVDSYSDLAHLRLVECYGAGHASIGRTDRLLQQLRTFLHEGNTYRVPGSELSVVAFEAIVAAILQEFRHSLVDDQAERLRRRLPELAFIAIAPFTGPAQAGEIIDDLAAR